MRAYTYSYRSSYHAHIVAHIVTHIVNRIANPYREPYRDPYRDPYRNSYRDPYRNSYRDPYRGRRCCVPQPPSAKHSSTPSGSPVHAEGDMQGKRNGDGETVQQCLAAGGCGTQHRRRWMGGKGGHRGRCRRQMQRRRRMQRTNTDTVFACRVLIEKHHWGECGHSFTLNLVLTS